MTTSPRFFSVDIVEVATAFASKFPEITAVSLFGSRRHGTRSLRSDIDLLVETDSYLRAGDVREFTLSHFSFVDAFIFSGTRAISCLNDSFVEADSRAALLQRLQAVTFWRRDMGAVLDLPFQRLQDIASGVSFTATTLPNLHIFEEARSTLFQDAEGNGMPIQPFMGRNAIEFSESLIEVLRRLIVDSATLSQRGRASGSWALEPGSEYEYQDLFWIVAKPWLPGLAREEVTIEYDGQAKRADFSYGGNQIVIEMKHVTSAGTKAAIAKTLSGLANFYLRHPNIRIAVFAILVDRDVPLDASRWEADFSRLSETPQVRTVVVRNR